MGEGSIVTEKSRMFCERAVAIPGAIKRCQRRKSIGVCLVVHRRWDVYRSHLELSVLVQRNPSGQHSFNVD